MPNLNTTFQEADFAIPLHALYLFNSGYEKVLVVSNDTDIDVMLLYFMPQFQEHGMKELWMQAGPSHAIRYIPLHLLHARMGNELCKVLPALYTLTGCDWTSKVGTKKSALEADAETLLQGFGKYPAIVEAEAKQAEKFLVNVLKRNSSSDTFTMLRKEIYPASPTRTHSDLPPTSYGLKPHLQRANFNTYLITNKSAHTRTPYDEHISGGLWIRAD